MHITLSPGALGWLKHSARPLAGRTVLLTGATGSLGRCACAELALLGARLIVPVRDAAKGEQLVAAVRELVDGADIMPETVDMADFASVDALAARLCAKGERIDCLASNAGVFSRAGIRTADGYELHQQVNALSPLRLTRALLPLLCLSDAPRVVAVTSLAAWSAKSTTDDPLAVKSATAAYGRSKLTLMRGMCALAREESAIAFLFAQPGICATDLFRAGANPTAYSAKLMGVALPLMRRVFMKPDKAALTTVYAVCAAERRLRMSAPRGLMGVWGYPVMRRVWKKALEG